MSEKQKHTPEEEYLKQLVQNSFNHAGEFVLDKANGSEIRIFKGEDSGTTVLKRLLHRNINPHRVVEITMGKNRVRTIELKDRIPRTTSFIRLKDNMVIQKQYGGKTAYLFGILAWGNGYQAFLTKDLPLPLASADQLEKPHLCCVATYNSLGEIYKFDFSHEIGEKYERVVFTKGEYSSWKLQEENEKESRECLNSLTSRGINIQPQGTLWSFDYSGKTKVEFSSSEIDGLKEYELLYPNRIDLGVQLAFASLGHLAKIPDHFQV